MDLGKEVERSLRRKGILGPASAAWVLEVANKESKGRFVAKTFRQGILTVSSKVPPARLLMESRELISAINKKIGRDLITKIRTRVDQ